MQYQYNRGWRNKQRKLNQIAVRAKRDKREKFNFHLINAENLAECYKELKRNKACGIDLVTVEDYGENLEEKIKILVDSMKRKQYQPQPLKRYIYQKLEATKSVDSEYRRQRIS